MKNNKIQITFVCDDCGHKENWLFYNLTDRDLAELEASDSNNLVDNCPKCNSLYYNMKNYKKL